MVSVSVYFKNGNEVEEFMARGDEPKPDWCPWVMAGGRCLHFVDVDGTARIFNLDAVESVVVSPVVVGGENHVQEK